MFEDRDRIARDLHDLVIQRLFAVGLGLQGASQLAGEGVVAARLETAVDDLDETIRDIRRTIFALGSMDAAADVQSEVTRLVDRAAGTLKFRPVLHFEGPVRSLVDEDLAPEVLAVLGEALSNASRHAEASSVEVLLAAGESVVLTRSRRRPRPAARGHRERIGEHAPPGRGAGRVLRGQLQPRLGDPAGVVGALGGDRRRGGRTGRRCRGDGT